MQKTVYVKPDFCVVLMETEQVLAASIILDGDTKGDEDKGADASGRRGGWGNLWD